MRAPRARGLAHRTLPQVLGGLPDRAARANGDEARLALTDRGGDAPPPTAPCSSGACRPYAARRRSRPTIPRLCRDRRSTSCRRWRSRPTSSPPRVADASDQASPDHQQMLRRVVSAQVPRTQYYPMPTRAVAIVIGECSLRRGECPVGPSTDDHLRLGPQPGDHFLDGARLDVFAGSVPIGHELSREPEQQHVLADVDVARRVRRPGPGAVVTVTAAVCGAPVDPVRVHSPSAHLTMNQPGEHVASGPSAPTESSSTTNATPRQSSTRTPGTSTITGHTRAATNAHRTTTLPPSSHSTLRSAGSGSSAA